MPDSAAPLPIAQVEHRIAGRIRLRVPSHRGDGTFFERAAAFLTNQPGVHLVRVNPRTASILIGHTGDEAAVLSAAKAQGLFWATAAPPGRAIAAARSPLSAKPASPLNLAAAGLAGAGLLQLMRGEVVGSASENLWNAYGLYAVTRQAGPSALLVAFGLLQIARGQVLGSATSLFLYAFSARRMARHQAGESTI